MSQTNTAYSPDCNGVLVFEPAAVAFVIIELGAWCQSELVGAIIDAINPSNVSLAILEAIEYNYNIFQKLKFFQIHLYVIAYPILPTFPSSSELVFCVICGTSISKSVIIKTKRKLDLQLTCLEKVQRHQYFPVNNVFELVPQSGEKIFDCPGFWTKG